MEYDIEKINRLFKGMTPRKISIISRLAGLTPEEIVIMRLHWLEDKSDVQICETMGYSSATLTRKRRNGHMKILDALDLYGLACVDELSVTEILGYDGLFYKAQDALVRFFIRNRTDESKQRDMVEYLQKISGGNE